MSVSKRGSMRDLRQYLPPGWHSDPSRNGFRAEFLDDDLVRFGFYNENGEAVGHLLTLDPRWLTGRVDSVHEHYVPGPRGKDGSKAQGVMEAQLVAEAQDLEEVQGEEEYSRWVGSWIGKIAIAQQAGLCVHCGEPSSQVKKLVAGPKSAICSECLDEYVALRKNDEPGPYNEVWESGE